MAVVKTIKIQMFARAKRVHGGKRNGGNVFHGDLLVGKVDDLGIDAHAPAFPFKNGARRKSAARLQHLQRGGAFANFLHAEFRPRARLHLFGNRLFRDVRARRADVDHAEGRALRRGKQPRVRLVPFRANMQSVKFVIHLFSLRK